MDFVSLNDNLDLLCAALRCSPEVIYKAVKNPEHYYEILRIRRRRRSRRVREVVKVKDPLRKVHRTIALMLKSAAVGLSDSVHGFRPDRSIRTNAQGHCGGRSHLVNVDLENFFGSIELAEVRAVFKQLGCGPQISLALARLCTYENKLPQGTRCSPMLANLVAAEIDRRFVEAWGGNCTYTRYADDLSFSGEWAPSEQEIIAVLRDTCFRVRGGSYRHVLRGGGQYVTGLFVGSATPRLPRRTRRILERFVYYSERYDAVSAAQRTTRKTNTQEAVAHMRGLLGWAKSIEATPIVERARAILSL